METHLFEDDKNIKPWNEQHSPEDVKTYDIFELTDRKKIIVNEIRRIDKAGVKGYLWEFVDRDTGRVCKFEELKWLLDYEG